MHEMLLVLLNFEIIILLTWSQECIIVTGAFGNNANNLPKFTIADTKLYVPVVTSSGQDTEKNIVAIKNWSKNNN